MGAGHSATSTHKIAELLFERGTDSLAVEVHSAAVDDEAVTVFTYNMDNKHKDIATNTLQAHKTLRHPSILKLVTCGQSGSNCHVVTEPATPLCVCLDYVSSWEITVGLTKILEALHFLHIQAGYSHNNLGPESIYVTPDGEWKLGRLDCSRKLSENSLDHIQKVNDICDPDVYPTQSVDKQCGLHTILVGVVFFQHKEDNFDLFTIWDNTAPIAHCRDINGFGQLCESLLDKLDSFDEESISEFGDAVNAMMSTDPSDVPSAAQILAQPLLSNHLVQTLKFVEEITLKSAEEKKEFFSTLADRLSDLPELVIAKLLVRPLLRRFVVEDEVAYTTVLPCLLTPKSTSNQHGLLSPSLYKKYLPPVLYRLFTVKEYHVRKLLLAHFHLYCHLLEKPRLEKFIMPQILQGLHDSSDIIVQKSLISLSDLVPVLGGRVVIGTDRRCTFIGSGGGRPQSNMSATAKHQLPNGVDHITSIESTTPDSPNHHQVSKKQRPRRSPRKPRQRTASETKAPKLGVKKIFTEDDNIVASVPTHTTELEDLPGTSHSQGSPKADHAQGVSQLNGRDDTYTDRGSEAEDVSDWDDFDSPTHSAPPSVVSEATSLGPSHSTIITTNRALDNHVTHTDTGTSITSPVASTSKSHTSSSMSLKSASVPKKKPAKINDDFSKLDIKSLTKVKPVVEEVDFFADMVPDIKSSNNKNNKAEVDKPSVNLAFALNTEHNMDTEGGWGDDEDGWEW